MRVHPGTTTTEHRSKRQRIRSFLAAFLPLLISTGCLDASRAVIGGNARWIKRNYTPEFNAYAAGNKFSSQEMEMLESRPGFPPTGALRVRDALWGGARFNTATEGNVGQEFFYSLGRAQVRYPVTSGDISLNYRVHNFGMNGLVYPTADKAARTRPFLSAGVGGVLYRPTSETRNVHQFGSDASFNFNYGVGLKQRIGSIISVRTDLRHFIARTPTFDVFPHRGAIHNLELSTGIVFHQKR